MRKKDNTDYYINRHSCFLLQYHIVFVTKYRHPVLTGKVKDVVYERIHYVADQRGFHILEINGESDHVHILMEADTTTSPAELANVLKTQTARKAPEGLISGAFRLPLRTIHFILPTGIIAYAFWCFKYSRMSNLAIQTATQNVIHWFLLEI